MDKFLGIKRKTPDQPTDQTSVKVKKSEHKSRDRWFSNWDKTFPWLQKSETNNQVRGICTWCRDAKKNNAMATTGTPNLQASTFSKHESTKDHKLACEARQARQKKETVVKVFEDQQARQIDLECDPVKEAQFNTVYYLAKEGQPLNQYTRLLALQIKNKCPHLQDPKKLYTSEELKSEILDSINESIEETVDRDIRNSEYIGLIIDESTDITVHKKLNVYVKCLNDNHSVIHFVDCISVIDGKAETIVSEIVKLFVRKGIPMSKLLSLASDGAAVMTGQHNGVGARLRREHNPLLMQVHCIAHKLALAAGQSCRDIPLFCEYQQTLKNIYRFFSNSAVRYNELRSMMELLDDGEMEYLALKEPASFRWLSLHAAVRAVSSCYPALYSTLEHEAAKGQSEAKGIFNKVKCVTFILMTGFLNDVLAVVTKLSKIFQRDLIDISTVNQMVESTLTKLDLFKTKNGPELTKVYDSLEETRGQYQGVKLTDREQLRIQFQNNATQYLEKLIENMTDRFDENSMRTLQLLNKVLNPTEIPKNLTSLDEHGEEELRQLADIYGQEHGILDPTRTKEDYFQVKVILKSLTCSLSETCSLILTRYKDIFPDFAALSTIVLTSPLTSVACERGFSTHNKIKTKGRACLKHETITKLMRIKEEGPSLEDFDAQPSVKKFLEKRKRRK